MCPDGCHWSLDERITLYFIFQFHVFCFNSKNYLNTEDLGISRYIANPLSTDWVIFLAFECFMFNVVNHLVKHNLLFFSSACSSLDKHGKKIIDRCLPISNLSPWNNKTSSLLCFALRVHGEVKYTKTKYTLKKSCADRVPFNNIQSMSFSVPSCYSEHSCKYFEGVSGDEKSRKQWGRTAVVASVSPDPSWLFVCSRELPKTPARRPAKVLRPTAENHICAHVLLCFYGRFFNYF